MKIKFSDVNYIYQTLDNKNTHALKNINLDLSDSRITAIIGQTGSGKSTAMQHINGLIQPTTGKMIVGELEITAKKNRKLLTIRKDIGYVFQNPNYQLFANSVLEDVMYGPLNFGYTKAEAKKQAEIALEMVGIDVSLHQKYPFDLSGGQMRKVAIAGALAYEPSVLILDEPTVGLDPLATNQITALFQKLHDEHGKSLIFITHDMEFVQEFSQRVIVFENGEINYDGDTFTLFNNHSLVGKLALDVPVIYKIVQGIKQRHPNFTVTSEDMQTIKTLAQKIKSWKGA
ncbi:MAG: ATP-binding cassette domain-containing protein [Culicoidibacterales bacterium]